MVIMMRNLNLLRGIWKGLWILPAIAVMSFAVYIVYPGGFSPDSIGMYAQATGVNKLTDVKPIFSIMLMRFGITLFGDGGLVIINSTLYVLGVLLISAALFTGFLGRLFTSLLLVSFPPLLLINLSNWIDPIVLSGLSISVGCILMYVYRSKKIFLLLGAAFFSIWALLARHNAPSIIFFIQFLIVYLWAAHCFSRKYHAMAMLVGILVLFGGSLTINPLLNRAFGVKHIPLWGWIYGYDIISISLLENKNLIPRELLNRNYREKTDEEVLAALRNKFMPYHNWNYGKIVNVDYQLRFMQYSLRTAFNYLGDLLFIRYRTNIAWLTTPSVAFELKLSEKRSSRHGITPQRKGKMYLKFVESSQKIRHNSGLFHAGWYVLAAFVFLGIIMWSKIFFFVAQSFRREQRLLASFSLASIFAWLPMIPLMVTAEFRYLIPVVFLVIVSILILLRWTVVTCFSAHTYSNSFDGLDTKEAGDAD